MEPDWAKIATVGGHRISKRWGCLACLIMGLCLESASVKMLPMTIKDDIYLSPDGMHHPLCIIPSLSSEGWCVMYGDDVCSSSELEVSSVCACRLFFFILREMWTSKQRNRK